MVVPCFTHVNAAPLIGTTCLRYVTITNRKYNTELQKLSEKIELFEKERKEKEKSEKAAEKANQDEAIDLANEKPGTSNSEMQ